MRHIYTLTVIELELPNWSVLALIVAELDLIEKEILINSNSEYAIAK